MGSTPSPAHTVTSACRGARRAPRAPRGILMGVGDSHRPCGCPAPTRRAQRARAGAPRGSGAAHCPPWRSATLTQMEHVRTLAFGDALRAAKTHPVTHSPLGASVVVVLGSLVSRWPPRGWHSAERANRTARCAAGEGRRARRDGGAVGRLARGLVVRSPKPADQIHTRWSSWSCTSAP